MIRVHPKPAEVAGISAQDEDELEKSGLSRVHGEPSYRLGNGDVELFVTPRGGHLGPVRFRLGKRWAQPYALAPWQPTDLSDGPPIIRVLRGDFFCLPFGSSANIRDVHGETANGTWERLENGPGRLVMEMDVKNPQCKVRKTLGIRRGQRAVYQEHRIEGLQGHFNFGHHAILQFPEKGGPYFVNTSPFRFGQVKPEAFSDPLNREYGALKTGARFQSLAKVPLAAGGVTSLQEYPARRGFEDLIQVSSVAGDLAWTAATLDGYVWISLKDPRVLPSTLFWLSNGGRHAPPWNGRHLGRLGLEEVCGHFSDGLEVSRRNLLRKHGVPTALSFRTRTPRSVRAIHLVHPVPEGFGRVRRILPAKSGDAVRIWGSRSQALDAPVDWNFLHGGS
jgi:hypothetical protein